MNANEKISAAIATTNDVSDLMDVVIACLRNQKINALGVYVSPQRSKGDKAIDVYKQCRSSDRIKSIVGRISESSTIIDRMTARLWTDNRNGQKAYLWLMAMVAALGLMAWQAITGYANAGLMATIAVPAMIFLKMTK